MAIISDDKFKIKIAPRYSNWWTFDFEFFYNNKPIFNPEITHNGIFEADEYHSGDILSMLEKAIECKVDEEIFYWEAWETEVVIEIKAFMKNLDKGTDGGFELTIFVGEAPFVDGETNYGFQNVGIRVFVDRESLKNFYIELKSEMQKVPNAPT